MPTVPSLEAPQVQEEPLPGRPFPRIQESVEPGAFGGPIAQGLEAVGAAGSEEMARQKTIHDQLRVIDANTQLESGRNAMLYGTPDQSGNMSGGAFSYHGTDAINLPAKMLPQYQKLAGQISSTLTPDQQRLFQPHIASGENELNVQLNRYEYEESNRLAGEVYKNGANQAIESASVAWRDPLAVGKSRADIKAIVQMQGNREGWDQSTKDAQAQKLLAQMHFSVIDRMLADGNPQAALNYFVGSKNEPGIRDSNELTGEQAHQLGSAIDSAIRQQGTDNQSKVASKVRDVRAAAINGQLIPPQSMPSNAELQTAFPDTWRQVRDGITHDVAMGSDMKALATMNPTEIGARVKSYEPSGVAGAAEGYDRYNVIAAAAQRSLAERAKDPRQFSIDNGLVSQPLNFKDMDALGTELRTRLASTASLSQRVGGYVPPLTRQEAQQLSQTLETQTPADRLRTLSALNTASGSDRGFQEVMRQVAPGSPVTAVVGSQISQTQPREAPVWFDHQFAQTPADQIRILQGNQLLNPVGLEKEGSGGKKSSFPMPPDGGIGGLREQFASKAGDVFRSRPELGETYFSAFKSAYASLLSEKGDMSGNGNSKLRDQAMKIALGNLAEFHGAQVAIPQGMDPSRFEGLLDKAIATRAQQYGAPQGWQDKIRGYQLREIGGLGSGRYELTNGNMPLMRPGGKGLFEVDVNSEYLPSRGAVGSPQDQQHQVSATAPQETEIPAGQPNVPRGTVESRAIKPPPLEVGRSHGHAHPSQGPEL